MVKLYSPKTEVELALIRSLLDAENIPYYVQNDHFGSLEVGPPVHHFNVKTIVVAEEHRDRAVELITDFLRSTHAAAESTVSRPSLFDKIRMALEVVVFAWIVPGTKWRKK